MGERWYKEQKAPRKRSPETFGAVCQTLQHGGFVPIPLDGKKPIPNGWAGFWQNPPSDKTYATWRKRNAAANTGICTGEIVAIDMDLDEPADALRAEAQIFSILGPTPFIRIGRSPRKAYLYRLAYEEARQTKSWKEGSIELLADGKQCAVFGVHPTTRQPYLWPEQSLLHTSVNKLPLVTIDQLVELRRGFENPAEDVPEEPSRFTKDYSPRVGERDKYLFWFAKETAATSSTLEDLTKAVIERNSLFSEPLSVTQASAKAKSAWAYKKSGKLLLSGTSAPTVIPILRTTIAGLIKSLDPQTAKLLLGLAATRHTGEEFTIPQKATAEAFKMSEGSLKKGLKQLLAFGILIDTGKKRASLQPRPAKIYTFGSGERSARRVKEDV
jgi:hypothetical protein